MQEQMHLTIAPELPTQVDLVYLDAYTSRKRCAEYLSSSLDFVHGSLRSMFRDPRNNDKLENFTRHHQAYNNDYINYIDSSKNYLAATYEPSFFVANLSKFITTVNNDRIERYNHALRRFGITPAGYSHESEEYPSNNAPSIEQETTHTKPSIFLEYTEEEITDDLQLPILRLVTEDDPYGLEIATKKAKELVTVQLDCESRWLINKRNEMPDKPNLLQKAASYMVSHFL